MANSTTSIKYNKRRLKAIINNGFFILGNPKLTPKDKLNKICSILEDIRKEV